MDMERKLDAVALLGWQNTASSTASFSGRQNLNLELPGMAF
jgi:hypothetical protein